METRELKHYLVKVTATVKDERGNNLSFTEYFISFGNSEEQAVSSIMQQEYFETDKFYCKVDVTAKRLDKLYGENNAEHIRQILAYYLIEN